MLSAISPNERLQYELHPWTSYVIVPLFALANAGIHLTGGLLSDAVDLADHARGSSSGTSSASRSAILGGLVAGHAPRLPRARAHRSAGRCSTAAAPCAGIGFTVSLLVSSLAFTGGRLDEAKLGVLARRCSRRCSRWVVFAAIKRLPASVRARQIGRTAEDILDLAEDVDPERDHIRGPDDAPVTLVEYGDFECPYCGQAEGVIRELLSSFGDDVRYVWRHLPLNDVHPNAQLAAEAAEAAAAQGKFWEMYDALLPTRANLTPKAIARTPRPRTRRRTVLGRDPPARARGARRRGRRQRRRERRVRHSDASSSTAAGTRAPTTSKRSPRRCGRLAGERGCSRRPEPDGSWRARLLMKAGA